MGRHWCPTVRPGQRLLLTDLPIEILCMIAASCYDEKGERRFHASRPPIGRLRRGGVDYLIRVCKLFYHICLGVQFSVISFTDLGHALDAKIANFTTTKPHILAGTRAVSIRVDLQQSVNPNVWPAPVAAVSVSPGFPNSFRSLVSGVSNLTELELSIHNADLTALRKVLSGKNKINIPLKALRISTPKHTSLAFIVTAFPNLEKLSIRVHGTYLLRSRSMAGWKGAQLHKLRNLKRLKTVQLERYHWRDIDLKEINKCFPQIERLMLLGRITIMQLSDFARHLSDLRNLRDLTIDVYACATTGRLDFLRPAGSLSAFGKGKGVMTFSGLRPGKKIETVDIEQADFAIHLFEQPGLARVQTIGLCTTLSLYWNGSRSAHVSRIYKRRFNKGIFSGVDLCRDYHTDVKTHGPGDFWFQGEPTLMMADRMWLKNDMIFSRIA